MIYGIGVDLIKIPRIAAALARFGDRFKTRIFTPGEISYCDARANSSHNYALRFAAKEAFSKALGVGLRRNGIYWREVEVVSTPSGRPDLQVRGRAPPSSAPTTASRGCSSPCPMRMTSASPWWSWNDD